MTITNPSTNDLEPVLQLLESFQLPAAGVGDHFSDFASRVEVNVSLKWKRVSGPPPVLQ